MINRQWDGVAAYRKPENKVLLRLRHRANNKIRVIQRCAYGLRMKNTRNPRYYE